jgi:hypothetical protein
VTGGFDFALEKKYLVNFGRGSRQCIGIKLVGLPFFESLLTMKSGICRDVSGSGGNCKAV